MAHALLISWLETMSYRRSILLVVLLATGCTDPQSGTPQPEPEHFQADTRDCEDIQEICLETDPPQCFEYCADEPTGESGQECTESDGDLIVCGDETCVEAEDEEGNVVRVCAGPDCVVSYDVETGEETISCPE